MPIKKSRYDYTKVYRPNGMRYAQGEGDHPARAVGNAELAFENEFGSLPRQGDVVIEVLGCTAVWVATYMEVIG
jgi:hypothetical protein